MVCGSAPARGSSWLTVVSSDVEGDCGWSRRLGGTGPAEDGYDPMRQFAELAGDVRDPYPMFAGIRADSPVMQVHFGPQSGDRSRLDPKAPRVPSCSPSPATSSRSRCSPTTCGSPRPATRRPSGRSWGGASWRWTRRSICATAPLVGQGLPRPRPGPVERHDHRRHRQRADRRLRRRRPRRPHPAADLSVPGPGHRPDPGPARERLAPVPAAVDRADRGHAELGPGGGGQPGASRLLRRDHRRPAAAPPRGPGEPADRGRGRRAAAERRGDLSVPAAAPARRGGDDLPVVQQPAVRPAVQSGPAGRGPRGPGAECRRRSRRRCGGRRRC